MKIGRRLGEKVGYPSGIGTIPQTVEVRIVNGMFVPCGSCHWFNVCVVPRGRSNLNIRQSSIRNYYQCSDYLAKTAQGYQQWYTAPYLNSKKHKPFNPNRGP